MLSVSNPLPENIRRKVKEKICANCHASEHSLGFDQIVEHVMPEVDHTRKQPSQKQIIDQRQRGPMKPQVELSSGDCGAAKYIVKSVLSKLYQSQTN